MQNDECRMQNKKAIHSSVIIHHSAFIIIPSAPRRKRLVAFVGTGPILQRFMGTRLTSREISDRLTARFGEKIVASFADDKHPRVHTDAEHWREIATFLLNDPSLKLDWLACLSGVDYVADEKFC